MEQIVDHLKQILNSSLFPTRKASNEEYAQLKNKLTTICELLEERFPDYRFRPNTGVGGRADCVWIGIKLKESGINDKSQSGLYLTILFEVMGERISLSIQQGSDNTSTAQLASKIAVYKSLIGVEFSNSIIKVHSSELEGTQARPKKYEKANVYGKDYSLKDIDKFSEDLYVIMKMYESLVDKIKSGSEILYQTEIVNITQLEEPELIDNDNNTKEVTNTKKEKRDPNQKAFALNRAKFQCMVNKSHISFPTNSMKNYVEGHHFVPLEFRNQYTKDIDHWSNIASLCPCCHKAIHLGDTLTRKKLIDSLYLEMGTVLKQNFGVTKESLYTIYKVKKR